jgi:hypothetical protein
MVLQASVYAPPGRCLELGGQVSDRKSQLAPIAYAMTPRPLAVRLFTQLRRAPEWLRVKIAHVRRDQRCSVQPCHPCMSRMSVDEQPRTDYFPRHVDADSYRPRASDCHIARGVRNRLEGCATRCGCDGQSNFRSGDLGDGRGIRSWFGGACEGARAKRILKFAVVSDVPAEAATRGHGI